jgi:hypothetical protein
MNTEISLTVMIQKVRFRSAGRRKKFEQANSQNKSSKCFCLKFFKNIVETPCTLDWINVNPVGTECKSMSSLKKESDTMYILLGSRVPGAERSDQGSPVLASKQTFGRLLQLRKFFFFIKQ